MYSRELIFEYENVLTENKPSVNPFLFNRGDYENERKALYIMRYAIQTYLRWNPYEVRDHMTHRILKMLKLEALLKYITFPSVIQIEEDRDLFYLAVKLYPKQIKYNENFLQEQMDYIVPNYVFIIWSHNILHSQVLKICTDFSHHAEVLLL